MYRFNGQFIGSSSSAKEDLVTNMYHGMDADTVKENIT